MDWQALVQSDGKKGITYSFALDSVDEPNKERKILIEEQRDAFLTTVVGMSEYDKAKAIYNYLIENVKADTLGMQKQNIASALLHKNSSANGYAKAAQYLLSAAGLEATSVLGTLNQATNSEPNRLWTMVKVDGNFYYFDVAGGRCVG